MDEVTKALEFLNVDSDPNILNENEPENFLKIVDNTPIYPDEFEYPEFENELTKTLYCGTLYLLCYL